MDFSSNLLMQNLQRIVSDAVLDDLIKTATDLDFLDVLLDLKLGRILQQKTAYLTYSVENLVTLTHPNIDFKCKVILKALSAVTNRDEQRAQLLQCIVDNLSRNSNNELVVMQIQLLSSILEVYKTEDKVSLIQPDIFARIDQCVAEAQFLKPHFSHLILKKFVDVYVQMHPTTPVIKIMCLHALSEQYLDAICINLNTFITYSPDLLLNSLLSPDFCVFLASCMTEKDNYQQKQVVYILSRSVEHILQEQVQYEYVTESEGLQKDLKLAWKNFFILLDVTNEKQLHLVEPSLRLLNSVICLHRLWQCCLYKKLLKHMQDLVSCFVSSYLLRNVSWKVFYEIIDDFLGALNRQTVSNEVSHELSLFCKKLSKAEYEQLLEKSLNVCWTPCAIWRFCQSIVTNNNNMPLACFEKFTSMLKLVPDTYVRQGCMHIITWYFLDKYSFDTLPNFTKILTMLQSEQTDLILKHAELLLLGDQLQSDLLLNLNEGNTLQVGALLQIYRVLHLEKRLRDIYSPVKQSCATDILHKHLLDLCTCEEMEYYVNQRIECLSQADNIDYFLSLCQKFCPPSLIIKANDILNNDSKYNDTQRAVAFYILGINCNLGKHIFDIWPKKIVCLRRISDERMLIYFVELLFKSFDTIQPVALNLNTILEILSYVFDSQNDAAKLIAYKNFHRVWEWAKSSDESHFLIQLYFDELIKIKKTTALQKILSTFLDQIISEYVLNDAKYADKIIDLSGKLLELPSGNSVVSILAEKIACLTCQQPQNSCCLIPVIIELILYGIIVQKHERAEYAVYQEISHKLHTKTSKNTERVAIKLFAMESMMNLVKRKPILNVAELFVVGLTDKYRLYFQKRYFPDSQIHLEKLRILQALLLVHPYISEIEKSGIVDLITNSFLLESHQPSVRHLMQWLLILLLKSDDTSLISQKLSEANMSRPSCVSCFMPVLYHLSLGQDQSYWSQVMDILLPYSMGAQFKLRLYSQVAILKLYEEATNKCYLSVLEKYKFLYKSIVSILEDSKNCPEYLNVQNDFLDYFNVDDYSNSDIIFYTICHKNGVTCTEWENLYCCGQDKKFDNLKFCHPPELNQSPPILWNNNTEYGGNIQKKIIPNFDQTYVSSTPTNDFILVTSLLEKATNLGGLSRTCEVFGIKQLAMRNANIIADKEFKSLSMSSENWINVMEVKVKDLEHFLVKVKSDGYCVVGAEQTSDSTTLDKFKFPKRTVLVLGNEKEGISPHLIPFLDRCIEIPQFGVVRSLNVHVAGAIVIWEYRKQHLL